MKSSVNDSGFMVHLNPNNAFKTTETTEVNIAKRKRYFKSLFFFSVFKFGGRLLAKSFSLQCTQRFTMGKGVIY
jgi:hypothetical protein